MKLLMITAMLIFSVPFGVIATSAPNCKGTKVDFCTDSQVGFYEDCDKYYHKSDTSFHQCAGGAGGGNCKAADDHCLTPKS